MTPVSVRTSTQKFTNGTYTSTGYPVVADGYVMESTNQLNIGTSKSVLSDDEAILAASTTNVNTYCNDAAGYNAIGIPKLLETFGWNGGAFSGGTRTTNADGSVTFSATHAGSTESAPIGGFSIVTGALNTACPIVTPAYTLAGGTVRGSYTIPITITFTHGLVTDLTVTNATLSNGDTLSVTTNTSVAPSNPAFINGTVASSAGTLATFSVNAFGNGTLTVASTGTQYVVTDWNVVR